MTEDIRTRLIKDMTDMLKLAEMYSEATSDIITTDIDETLEEILERRSNIIAAMGRLRADIDAACEKCTDQESDLVHRMMRGANVPLGLSSDLQEIHKTAVRMHSVYIAVTEKEKQAAARVDARVKELRSELRNVNEDRRKASGYTAVGSGFGGSGGSFDGRL